MRILAVSLLTVGCVSRVEPPKAAPGPPELAWKSMSRDQRMAYMEKVVVPEMQPLFVAIDPERFASFGCQTCHGPTHDDGTYDLPNPELMTLPGTPKGMIPLARDKWKWVDGMTRQIKPKMAVLLGLEEFDPANAQPDAFGCHSCHRIE